MEYFIKNVNPIQIPPHMVTQIACIMESIDRADISANNTVCLEGKL